MIPNTFFIFGFGIPLYGIFVSIGILAYAITTILIFEKREKIDKKTTNKILLLSIPCLMVLALSAFIFNSLFHSIEEGKIVLGGITWLGGFIGLIPFTFFIFHKFIPASRGKEMTYISLLIPGIVLGHGFGRIGCFFGGCCFGTVTDLPIGVIYPEGSLAAELYPGINGGSMPVLPTQLFEALFEFILFFALLIKPKKWHQFDVEIYCIGYAIFRFIIEFYRADDRGGTGLVLSPSQLMSILIFILGILFVLMENGLIIKSYKRKMVQGQEAVVANNNVNKSTIVEKLETLEELKSKGLISEEEYQEKRKNILGEF